MSTFHFQDQDTILLHGGQVPDPVTGSRAVPIHQTTSYVFPDSEHAQGVFALQKTGNIYTRITNPTVDAFEQRVSILEDGVAAVATSSGMAAITFAILNIASAGDEIVTDSNLYGGTYNLFVHTLPRYGINVKFVDGSDPENFREAITDKTKAVYGETITNPSLYVFDIEAVADIAHEHGIPLIIDNTFAPGIAHPLKWGADIVVHSATKWIGGHGNSIAGVVVDGGKFDWSNGKFPGFTEPDDSYNGLRYVDVGAPAFAIKLRVQLLRDIGACLSPHNAFLLLQGLETLHLRMERHAKNTEKVVKFLTTHPAVDWVNYPGLKDHPSHELAHKYFTEGYGSIVTFGIKGGRDAGRKAIDNVKLWSHVANVGDAKSLIIHPASTTHQQLSAEDLEKSGVNEELIRLSIGLESVKDILEDLDQAMSKAVGIEPSLTNTEDSVTKWLVHSPFDRSEGLRQKVIAVADIDETKVAAVKKAGYQIIAVDAISSTDQVDALWVKDNISKAQLTTFTEKQGKIIWVENEPTGDIISTLESIHDAIVFFNKDLVEEIVEARTSK